MMSPSSSTLLLWGLDHHHASTEMRERAHLGTDKLIALHAALAASPGVVSCVPVSTCNRTEIYLETEEHAPAADILAHALRAAGVDPELFAGEAGLRLHGRDVADHLFRVAAGMESMMLGEPQIASQLKDAYRTAKTHNELGPVMMRLFQGAFRAGKRVRTGTKIGAGAVSVAFAAVELARKFFSNLGERRALLVGAGETGELAARHFLQQGIGGITVVNRSPERAVRLVTELNEGEEGRARMRPWASLTEELAEADVVLSTTGATEPVITPDMVHAACKHRKGRSLFLLDIAVPRDVHPDVAGACQGIYLFGLDDLDDIVQANLVARRRELPRAESILADELAEFDGWIRDLDLVPTVDEFRAYLEDLKDKQVDWVRKKESEEVAAAVEASLQQFIKKVTGRSMAQLKQADTREERLRCMDTLKRLFGDENRRSA
ncbi:glutamyl-tRNA reductase [bacterium]|nr:glutamyl-tRNA reductase [bacterium]HPF34902.1 glutamyl-tRNA reductase [Candidatus Krumholzibacteria bacterium]